VIIWPTSCPTASAWSPVISSRWTILVPPPGSLVSVWLKPSVTPPNSVWSAYRSLSATSVMTEVIGSWPFGVRAKIIFATTISRAR